MNTPPLLRATKTGKRFANGLTALKEIDLEITGGQFVTIVGPSGCGKSTFLRLIAGLEPISSGQLTLDDQPPLEARRSRQNLAYVFQDPTLLPWRTVSANVALPLELQHQAPDASTNGSPSGALSVEQALDLVDMGEFAQAYPGQLSGGMRMRTSIARALVTRPGLLLMDEPFGALDEITRQRLNEDLLRLWVQNRWTCIFITHNVAEAVFLSQRVLVMSPRPGRIVAEIPIPFGDERPPQLRTSTEFNQIAAHISEQLSRKPAP